eukprot:199496_1
MASFEEVMQKAPCYLTDKFDKEVSDAFLSYIEGEEIDEIDTIINDIASSASKSNIVEYVSSKFNWKKLKQESFYISLRVLFELEHESEEQVHKLPTEMDWTKFTDSECRETREYINKQCFNSFSDYDRSFITIETIGRNYNINIVPLLFDIYSFYKYKHLSNSARNMTHAQFCGKSKVFHNIQQRDDEHRKIFSSLVQALASFQYRMIPMFNIDNAMKIDNDINAFIEYTMNVSQMLNKIVTQNQSCLPLLVDFWIIPSKVKEALNVAADVDDDDDSDSDSDSDSDDDDDDDKEDDEIKEDPLPLDFADVLKKYGATFEMGTIDYRQEARCKRTLRTVFQKVLNNSRRSIKICVVIDQRKDKNNLLIYQLPLKYSAIPRNYCNETLIYSSSEHLMYDVNNSVLKLPVPKGNKKNDDPNKKDPIFGARVDCDGRMFCLSFALHETNRIRIQFWRNGGGVRFWPQYMTTVWPKLFINPKINKKYKQNDYVANNFGLNVKDALFDAWYNSIVDFDK